MGSRKASSTFERAAELDPQNASAHAAIAEACSYFLLLHGGAAPEKWVPEARQAAQTALLLDDSLATAHASLGCIAFYFDWKWDEAEAQFRKALELDPNCIEAHMSYSVYLWNLGRFDEALRETEWVLEADPLNVPWLQGLGYTHCLRARYTEAKTALAKAREIDPTYPLTPLTLAFVYLAEGEPEKAVQESKHASELARDAPQYRGALGYALARAGFGVPAREILDELLALAGSSYVSPAVIAWVYIGLGDHEKALDWLEKAFAEHATVLVSLRTFPLFDDLRSNLRFEALINRMRFPSTS